MHIWRLEVIPSQRRWGSREGLSIGAIGPIDQRIMAVQTTYKDGFPDRCGHFLKGFSIGSAVQDGDCEGSRGRARILSQRDCLPDFLTLLGRPVRGKLKCQAFNSSCHEVLVGEGIEIMHRP